MVNNCQILVNCSDRQGGRDTLWAGQGQMRGRGERGRKEVEGTGESSLQGHPRLRMAKFESLVFMLEGSDEQN